MEKDLPPPYSATYAPPPGFNVPPEAPPQHVYTVPPPPIHQQRPTVVITNVAVHAFGPYPQPTVCNSCHQQITTKIISEPSLKTHIMAVILCLFGCIPCCLIPYCVDSCQSRNHYCSNCSSYLGTYNDMPYRGF